MRDETKKLSIEGLESRVAPFTIYSEPSGDDPLAGGGGGGSSPSVPDQPGNSDDRRSKLWHENQP